MALEERTCCLGIARRLDEIENRRRAVIASRYRFDYPDMSETEVSHVAEILATTRVRLIAETALSLLPPSESDRVLARFES